MILLFFICSKWIYLDYKATKILLNSLSKKKYKRGMERLDAIKIFFLALIVGNVMGVVLIQVFHNLTVQNVIAMEIALIFIIIMLFVSTYWWKKRQNKDKNKNIL
jgi:high-affinity Fe2+/Pb2+ permease